MKFKKHIFIFILLIMSSCATDKLIFQDKQFNDFENLNLKAVYQLERQSKDISPAYLMEIGEDIYPNKSNYVLATPKIYKTQELPNFNRETDYYYTVNDSLVKVILYQWEYLQDNKYETLDSEEYKTKKFKVFQTKFDNLVEQLTQEFGAEILKSIQQEKDSNDSFRDDYKFRSPDGLNAYLFMFGNNKSGYRQIRLAIYKD